MARSTPTFVRSTLTVGDGLDVALQQFRALGMTGWIRRAESLEQENGGVRIAERGMEEERESAIRTPQSAIVEAIFHREGEYWSIAWNGAVFRLRDTKGLQYIAQLLRRPGQEFHVRELLAAVDGTTPTGAGHDQSRGLSVAGSSDAGPVLDAKAKAAYKQRLTELRVELEDAERCNDPGRTQRAREEIEVLNDELSAAAGLRGRDRHAVSDAERARLAVTKRIKAALTKIRHANPDLAQHLTAANTTGYFCCYAPRTTPPAWSV